MCSKCKQDCLDLSFPATQAQASAGIVTLSARLAAYGLPVSKADDVKIALAEAINNVVKHAYAGIAPADIQIDCCLCKDKLVIQITDTGKPMPNLRLPDGPPAPVDAPLQDLPEGGFGWHLIRQLTSNIQYERRDGGNRLCLRFDFDEAP
ncbi:serine/threonine-protein kinase RsbW [Ruegeria halocynthiae]|uniref:Serine/threonine-protein kinase RsbW n=1 Tax=Ruegeria halocynthiae TaxID=985054 RepID=A0A1H3C285_9RHOB|nr:ATP-binding protein [Ruegeria halocynthiae]SDX48191.1 serine/threonine-protein kinase RsbW [Ruegeria halocynthiae]